MPLGNTPSREQMAEDVVEFAKLFDEIRRYRIAKDRDAYKANPAQARALADLVRNACRTWIQNGEFPVYYQVPSGRVHTILFCRTINLHTALSPLPEIAGIGIPEVEAMGYQLCAHCRKRTAASTRRKVELSCANWVSYLTE